MQRTLDEEGFVNTIGSERIGVIDDTLSAFGIGPNSAEWEELSSRLSNDLPDY